MISLTEYFGSKPHTDEHEAAAIDLLARRDALRAEYYAATGAEPDIDPDTGTEISGSKGGSGDGGFRLPTATTGRTGSAHKDAKAVDDSDQDNSFDDWLNEFEDGNGGNSMLKKHGLYREHPIATPTWVHLTTRAPGSGKRTYTP